MKTLIKIVALFCIPYYYCSCNTPTLNENRSYDLFSSDSSLYSQLGTNKIKLVVCTDYTFHFEPKIPQLASYEGRWKYVFAVDIDTRKYMCKNGNVYSDLSWYNVAINNKKYTLFFRDIVRERPIPSDSTSSDAVR